MKEKVKSLINKILKNDKWTLFIYYNGQLIEKIKVDENFKKFFYYRINEDGNIIITDIKKNGDELESYLSRCTPIYVTVKGWEQKTSEMREKRQLPKECIAYISRLEKIIRVPITMVSVGPTRENKISFEQKWAL